MLRFYSIFFEEADSIDPTDRKHVIYVLGRITSVLGKRLCDFLDYYSSDMDYMLCNAKVYIPALEIYLEIRSKELNISLDDIDDLVITCVKFFIRCSVAENFHRIKAQFKGQLDDLQFLADFCALVKEEVESTAGICAPLLNGRTEHEPSNYALRLLVKDITAAFSKQEEFVKEMLDIFGMLKELVALHFKSTEEFSISDVCHMDL